MFHRLYCAITIEGAVLNMKPLLNCKGFIFIHFTRMYTMILGIINLVTPVGLIIYVILCQKRCILHLCTLLFFIKRKYTFQ